MLCLIKNLNQNKACFIPSSIILSPTRELTEQTYKVARLLLKNTGITCAKIYGGHPHWDQTNEMSSGCDILIATPGRLIDFLKRGNIILNYVNYLVLDEADRMLDMGFDKQIAEIVFRFNMPPKEERQSLLFSATFSKEVYSTAESYIKNYLIATNNLHADEFSINENVKHEFHHVEQRDKDLFLHKQLQDIKGKTIGKFIFLILIHLYIVCFPLSFINSIY
jgi:ATP-dependent RNA helicase DDX3X